MDVYEKKKEEAPANRRRVSVISHGYERFHPSVYNMNKDGCILKESPASGRHVLVISHAYGLDIARILPVTDWDLVHQSYFAANPSFSSINPAMAV
ncbi:hypothetical protein BaRGS_00001326 [Batillaria attramentaria]|uniref:Uncharacterized protein n=1 Tax=Batillaria attramentaria TaxID=370345 RepID=A0ABD0M7T3_9CAEN